VGAHDTEDGQGRFAGGSTSSSVTSSRSRGGTDIADPWENGSDALANARKLHDTSRSFRIYVVKATHDMQSKPVDANLSLRSVFSMTEEESSLFEDLNLGLVRYPLESSSQNKIYSLCVGHESSLGACFSGLKLKHFDCAIAVRCLAMLRRIQYKHFSEFLGRFWNALEEKMKSHSRHETFAAASPPIPTSSKNPTTTAGQIFGFMNSLVSEGTKLVNAAIDQAASLVDAGKVAPEAPPKVSAQQPPIKFDMLWPCFFLLLWWLGNVTPLRKTGPQ
jgi:hypothetical protein